MDSVAPVRDLVHFAWIRHHEWTRWVLPGLTQTADSVTQDRRCPDRPDHGMQYVRTMRIRYQVVAFDASDVESESAFWAGVLGGEVDRDDGWHMVIVDGDHGWECSTHRTTSRRIGRMAHHRNRSTSTCGSRTSRSPTHT